VRHKNIQYDGWAGGETTADKLDLTPDLVRRAETKLVGLHVNRSQLRRRIRALHYLLRTLDTKLSLSKLTAPALHPEAGKSNFNHDERSKLERHSGTADISPFGSMNTTIVSAVIGVSTELRRACRIALMESDRPQPCEQILQRIRRRESVCIDGFPDPEIAVAQELRAMLADGEVISKKDNQLWQLNRDSNRSVGLSRAAGK
jgi:hypothetical protein